MKKAFLTGLILLSFIFAHSQIKAITESGDQVILNQDGSWAYVNNDTIKSSEIKINDQQFYKNKASTFLVKSNKLNVGIWINPKIWKFNKAEDNEAAEFQFRIKGEDMYGMLISEKIEVPIEKLKDIAFENAKNAAPDIKIIKEEYRNVNGLNLYMMQMSGTIQGIKFIYYGYYYSNSNGTVQFLTYTSLKLFESYKQDMEDLLNGLVETK
jgi:hypothetical protein